MTRTQSKTLGAEAEKRLALLLEAEEREKADRTLARFLAKSRR